MAEVTLDQNCKKKAAFQGHGKWAWDGSWERNLMAIVEFFGRLSYGFNKAQRQKALQTERMGS